eukprot:9400218-Ditylum_brightwellii.AAC.2
MIETYGTVKKLKNLIVPDIFTLSSGFPREDKIIKARQEDEQSAAFIQESKKLQNVGIIHMNFPDFGLLFKDLPALQGVL